MLIALKKLLDDGRGMTVKKSTIRERSDELTKSRRKAKKYFRQLHEAGVLGGWNMTGWFVEQVYGESTRQFVELDTADGFIDWISLTSTRTTIHRVLNQYDWKSRKVPFDTVSGMCLFGSGTDWIMTNTGRKLSAVSLGVSQKAMVGSVRDGEIVVNVGGSHAFSIYELEKTLRIAEWVRRMARNGSFRSHTLITPRIQYLLYFADAYALGRISPEAYLEWIRLVRNREVRIYKLFESLLGFELTLDRSPLEEIEEYLTSQISRAAPFDLDTVTRHLRESSESWAETLQVGTVSTWKQLINLSYVVAFSLRAKESAQANSYLIHGDDPLEYVILSEAARLDRAKRALGMSTYPWIGAYFQQRLGQRDSSLDSCLYDYRPRIKDFEQLEIEYPTLSSDSLFQRQLRRAREAHQDLVFESN